MTPIDFRAVGADRPRKRQCRVIAFGLAGEDWDVLIDLAESEGRDPEQQARWVVLQAIRGHKERRAS